MISFTERQRDTIVETVNMYQEKQLMICVEEMAEWLEDGINECNCCAYGLNFGCPDTCIYGIKQWLEGDVEENDR